MEAEMQRRELEEKALHRKQVAEKMSEREAERIGVCRFFALSFFEISKFSLCVCAVKNLHREAEIDARLRQRSRSDTSMSRRRGGSRRKRRLHGAMHICACRSGYPTAPRGFWITNTVCAWLAWRLEVVFVLFVAASYLRDVVF